MKYIVGYQSNSSVRLKMRVIYRCSRCGNWNDEIQETIVSGSASGNRWANQEQLKKNAASELMQRLRNVREDVDNHNYRKLKLTCRCQLCGTAPIWTKYYPTMERVAAYGAFIGHSSFTAMLTFMAVFALIFLIQLIPPIGFLSIIALFSPILYGVIKNIIVQWRVSRCEADCLPDIVFTENDD